MHSVPGPRKAHRRSLTIIWLLLVVAIPPSAAQPTVDCDQMASSQVPDGDCLPKSARHRTRHTDEPLQALHSSHSRGVSSVQDSSLGSVQTEAGEAAHGEQTLAAYVEEHADMHGHDNQRWRRFVQWSALFNSTPAASHTPLLEWFHRRDDVFLDQPISFLNQTNLTREWVPKDEEWYEIHRRHAQEMVQHKELDLILYGDSIFESILGTSVGHEIGRARGIPEVWSSYRSTSARKVLSITGDTTVDLTWRLLNGAMPLHVTVKKVVIQIGANNILKQWFQIPEDFEPRTSAIAGSIISVCDLILAAWPHTNLVLSGVLVGGVRGDWKDETRNWTLPNRYSESAAAINMILEDWVMTHEDVRVSYVDCSQLYIIDSNEVPGAFAIDANLLPDTLHPNRVGFKMLLDKCFEPALYGSRGTAALPSAEPG